MKSEDWVFEQWNNSERNAKDLYLLLLRLLPLHIKNKQKWYYDHAGISYVFSVEELKTISDFLVLNTRYSEDLPYMLSDKGIKELWEEEDEQQ